MSKDFFSEDNIPQSNWMQFKKVEDRIQGVLVGVSEKPAEGQFSAQKVFKIDTTKGIAVINGEEQEKGDWNVGISVNKHYVLDRISRAKLGQMIGFKFTEEIPATTKGFNPAKSITPFLGEMDPEYLMANDEGNAEGVNHDEVPFE